MSGKEAEVRASFARQGLMRGIVAAPTELPAGVEVLTLEYKIDVPRPAAGGRLASEGAVLRAGRSVLARRAEVYMLAAGRRLGAVARVVESGGGVVSGS